MTSTANNTTAELTDVLEERLIDAEYKIWKKNTPYLYDFVLTHSLEWPSLTCQWLPTVRKIADGEEHSLLIGTHTTGEQNYLMTAVCNLPSEQAVVQADAKASVKATTLQYDEEKKEIGGFGHGNSNIGRIEIKMKVKHEGEVNRARYMPQNHFVVASRGPSPEIYIFDLSKHPSVPQPDSPSSPQGVCIGHQSEGYSMAWSKHTAGHLVTGADDTTVKLWDVSAALASKASPGTQITASATFKGHTATVEDVDWHAKDAHMIGSVGDDRNIFLWDTRRPEKEIHGVKNAHEDDINCIAFNPLNENIFATGSADKTVSVWDVRNLKSYVPRAGMGPAAVGD